MAARTTTIRNTPTFYALRLSIADNVVALEAKFDSDAQRGFGSCSQPGAKNCSGNYGLGSDLKGGTSASCRLETWDGVRSPRLYWAWEKRFFQPSVFQPGRECPFASHHYQLMRNFLFAAAFAAREGRQRFGMFVVCPRQRAVVVSQQLETFKWMFFKKKVNRGILQGDTAQS